MPKFIRIIILFAFLLSACQPKKESNMNTTAENPVRESGQPNHLIDEKSPYLLQHAYNPVDWYPWGEEAFEKARRENKLIFLSIGYSTCHWCHVMEAESFEDEEVAQLLNETFVSIKVDREERPDIDAIYMDVAMALNGSGGWPLNIIMTAEQEPFSREVMSELTDLALGGCASLAEAQHEALQGVGVDLSHLKHQE